MREAVIRALVGVCLMLIIFACGNLLFLVLNFFFGGLGVPTWLLAFGLLLCGYLGGQMVDINVDINEE